ncbi:MAG: hypothetical protein ACXADB_00995 [Candidatus Hermodarchaeia archaeon]|jgi:hypothetical protein
MGVTQEGLAAMKRFAQTSGELHLAGGGIKGEKAQEVLAAAHEVVQQAPDTHTARVAEKYIGLRQRLDRHTAD